MADLPTIRQRITLGVAPTIDEARALVDALDAMERMPRLISAPGHTTGTIDHTKLRRLCTWDMTTRRPGGSRRIVHAGLTWPGLVVALLDEVERLQRDAALGAKVRDAVGLWASDPDRIAQHEELRITDEGEPDGYRDVFVVDDEQVEILNAIADAARNGGR